MKLLRLTGSLPDAGVRLEARILEARDVRRSAGDVLDVTALAKGRFDDEGRARLETGDLSLDRPIELFVLMLPAGRKRPRIVHRARFDSLSDIPDRSDIEFATTGDTGDRGEGKDDGREPARGPDADPTDKPTQGQRDGPSPAVEPVRERRPARRVTLPESPSDMLIQRQRLTDGLVGDMRIALSARVGERIKRLKAGRDFADRALGQRPLDGRIGEHFAAHGTDPERTARKVRKEGLGRLAERSDMRQGLTLHSDALVDHVESGELDHATLVEALGGAARLARVERFGSPLERCRNQQRAAAAEAALVEADQEGQDAVQADEVDRESPRTVEAILSDILATPAFKDALAARPDGAEVEKNLQMTLASGPADRPAWHDYQVLHVAWGDTWVAALDHEVQGKVAELFMQIVEIVDYEPPRPNSAEVDELTDLLTELSEVVSSVQAEMVGPSALAAWLDGPDVDVNAAWPVMSAHDQQVLLFHYTVHVFAEANVTKLTSNKTDNFSTEEQADDFAADIESGGGEVLRVEFAGTSYAVTYKKRIENGDGLEDYEEFDGYDASLMLLYPEPICEIDKRALARSRAIGLVNAYADKIDTGDLQSPLGRAESLISDLQRQSDLPYQFNVFATNSYNFGILSTYRQNWLPLGYQAGDLAATLPLAPNEKRSFTITRSRSRTTSSGSSRMASQSSDEEMSMLARAEAEIVHNTSQALQRGSNYSTSVGGDVAVAKADLTFGGTVDSDLGSDSSRTKNDINETTRRMAMAYRNENKVEVASESTRKSEVSETREISNPNNEITVTYLFYELQRRFEVSTRLNRVEPVILVAFRVPAPDEINEAWLLRHEWILRDELLDRKFRPTLEALSSSFTGDEVAVEILEAQWKTQLAIVAELRRQMGAHNDLRDAARAAVQSAGQEVAAATGAPGGTGSSIWDVASDAMQYSALATTTGVGGVLAKALFDLKDKAEDSTGQAPSGDALAEERASARQALDWADLDHGQAEASLREGIGALERATERYLQAVRARLDRRSRIDQLILHIRVNILHYMQAIWRREHPDQRYLRLYDLEIDWPADQRVKFTVHAPVVTSFGSGPLHPMSTPKATGKIAPAELTETRRLHQVADLDRILGFRGNYAVFRLKEPNILTTFMLQDFLDEEFGLRDPDPEGETLTTEEALALAQCAWTRPDVTDADKEEIATWLVSALDAANRVSQEITIPTGELFIEALPGAHPVLEDFKLMHRAADAHKAGAEAKMADLEVVRRAQRLATGDVSDPEIDKRVEIRGKVDSIEIDPDS